MVESLHHQVNGEAATPIRAVRYSRDLTTDEQAYQRTVKVTEEWTQLDRGWIGLASQLRVKNDGKDNILLGVKVRSLGGEPQTVVLIIVEPGESCRFQPYDLGHWSIRSRSGDGRISVVITPR